VQADEPLLNISLVENVITNFKDGAFNVAVSKLADVSICNPNEVKVALSLGNRIRFASRGNVPFGRDSLARLYKIHGVYSYDIETLTRFLSAPVGPLESVEKVEQLRCIENDIPIFAVLSANSEISVDTQEDYKYMLGLPKRKFELL
jgi:3-deoxy-manno-octulosonate cytidylyltransferase (CMP-KDO synthetase)